MLTWPPKDPDEVLDYQIDWTAEMQASEPADTIVGSVWILSDPDLVKDSDDFTTLTATIWLSGGTIGETYQCTNRITTAAGRVFDLSAKLKIKAK